MASEINLNLTSDDWKLFHSIREDNGLSMNKTVRLLVELGLYTYTLNKDIIDYI